VHSRYRRRLADAPISNPQVIGVDDFALRRGHVYGTVTIDILTHRPLDLLADRTCDTFAAWLRAHPGVQIVCRDRAGAYADAIRTGVPDAVQVADRWHLWRNLVEAVEKIVRAHHADLRAPDTATTSATAVSPDSPDGDSPDGDSTHDDSTHDDSTHDDSTHDDSTHDDTEDHAEDRAEDGPVGPGGPTRLAARTRERFAAVHDLLAAGMPASMISQTLGLDRKTVRRFARAGSVAELLTARPPRAGVLDAYTSHLHQRWAAGVTDAAALTAEITALGHRGSTRTVRRYLQPLRAGQTTTPRPPAPATTREATGWLTRHPDHLTQDETAARDAVLDRSPALRTTHDQVAEFAQILTQRRGHDLQDRMRRVAAEGAPAMRSFATGLERDLDAVTAGLTLTYSSGPVEGTVNRIKMIKRQMFGRANFDLLRKRVLLAVAGSVREQVRGLVGEDVDDDDVADVPAA
jgi:transposase